MSQLSPVLIKLRALFTFLHDANLSVKRTNKDSQNICNNVRTMCQSEQIEKDWFELIQWFVDNRQQWYAKCVCVFHHILLFNRFSLSLSYLLILFVLYDFVIPFHLFLRQWWSNNRARYERKKSCKNSAEQLKTACNFHNKMFENVFTFWSV